MIESNTFAEACYDMNTIEELKAALSAPADTTAMRDWGLTKDGYFSELQEALEELQSEQ